MGLSLMDNMTVEFEFFRGFKSNLVFALPAAMISSFSFGVVEFNKMEFDLAFVIEASYFFNREGSH